MQPHKFILLGASTGGPGHIEHIITSLPEDFDAVLIIAQHMGDEYLGSFAARLNKASKLPVTLAQNGESIRNGSVYICTRHCEIRNSTYPEFSVTQNTMSRYNPDINALFSSAECLKEQELLAIIMTGIGDDGVEGMQKLNQKKVKRIAESEATAIVYGMPMRAAEVIENILICSLDEIIEEIKRFGA